MNCTANTVLIGGRTLQKLEVDDIYEHLLTKGVDAVSIHGGKGQDERQYANKAFKDGKVDVLVATDVASKGLDFMNTQHNKGSPGDNHE